MCSVGVDIHSEAAGIRESQVRIGCPEPAQPIGSRQATSRIPDSRPCSETGHPTNRLAQDSSKTKGTVTDPGACDIHQYSSKTLLFVIYIQILRHPSTSGQYEKFMQSTPGHVMIVFVCFLIRFSRQLKLTWAEGCGNNHLSNNRCSMHVRPS